MDNDFKDILLITYNNIAVLQKNSNKKSAIAYLNRAYSLAAELENDYEKFNILINLSAVHLSIGSEKNIAMASSLLKKAERLAIHMKNEENLFFVYFNYGGYYSKINQYDQSINNYAKALSYMRKGINQDQNANLYEAIAEAHRKAGNFEQAFNFQEKQNRVKDSIFSLEKNKAFNEIQIKYEVEKKNLQISLLEKEKQIEESRKKLYLYLGVGLLISMLPLTLYLRNRVKSQKIIREKETELYKKETQRQLQDQELKRILGVAEGQDKERNRIAREIHDGIGRKIAGLKLHLEQVNTSIRNSIVHDIVGQLANVFQELRSISHNLSNNYINDTSLSVLVYDLLNDYSAREEFMVELSVFPEDALENLEFEKKHQLYRILQELINNVSRHAKANNVSVNFTRHEGFLNILVEDNGIGISAKKATGVGLKNIQERLHLIEGTINIETIAGEGTSIIINIHDLKND